MFEVIIDKNSVPIKVVCNNVDITHTVLQQGFNVSLDTERCILTMSVTCDIREAK